MSSRALLLLAFLTAPARLPAQAPFDSTAYLRARVARLDSLLGGNSPDLATRRRLAVEHTNARPMRVQTEGRLTLAVPLEVPSQWVSGMARAADSTLGVFGGIPDDALRRPVMLETSLAADDTALARFRGRPVLSLSPVLASDSARSGGHQAIEAMARYFTSTLDSTWQNWFDGPLAVSWDPVLDGEHALDDLAAVSGYISGRECLAGVLASCRLWLGLDADAHPYAARYRAQELVSALKTSNAGQGNPVAERCRAGDGQACAEYLERGFWGPVPLVPASVEIRNSLLRELRERHGTEALRRVLADNRGSVGDRMSRASGISEDSLVAEWRMWVLGRGRMERVTAGPGDLVSALLFSAILLGMAVRSGRWR